MVTRESRAEAMEALWAAYAAHPSSRLREQLIEQYRPVALSVLKHLGCRGDEDLEQVAMLGLVKAVDRFDPASGNRFSTFAVPTIMGEVRRHLRDHSRPVRPPRWLFELHSAAATKEAELMTQYGRAPTLVELARALEVDLDRLLEAMAMEESCHPHSLDGLLQSLEHERLTVLTECLGAEDPELARIDERLAWEPMLQELGPTLRRVIELRFYEAMTQKETADQLGVSQMQVSRLERRALERLRTRARVIAAIEQLSPPEEKRPPGTAH